MCSNCLKTEVDITEGISKQVRVARSQPGRCRAHAATHAHRQVTIFYCKGCGRYLGRDKWVSRWRRRERLARALAPDIADDQTLPIMSESRRFGGAAVMTS
jgi:hypothetical protein